MDNKIKEIYEKFCNGDSLTDDELAVGIDHFNKAATAILPLGPRFVFAANELQRVADGLEGYAAARLRNKRDRN